SLGVAGGAVGLYYMYRCYRIPARPYWNHWQTGTSFLGNSLVLGSLFVGVLGVPYQMVTQGQAMELLATLAPFAIAGLILESIGLYFHARDLANAEHEGAVSHYIQTTTFGKSYLLRNVLLGLNMILITTLALTAMDGWLGWTIWMASAFALLLTSLTGGALIKVLGLTTSRPGAFYRKIKGYVVHARETGHAGSPAVGVAMHRH